MVIQNTTKIIRFLSIIFLIALSTTWVYSQDEGEMEYREIPGETIDRLMTDEDLNYPLEVGEKAGWFQTLFEWIITGLQWFGDLISKGGLSNEFVYLISFIAAGVLIWLLLRSRASWIFAGRSKEGKIDYAVHHEDIHSIDFETQIANAIKNEDYRLAVRLVYLRTLKLMTDYQMIHWAEGKTNNQYTRELKDKELRSRFMELSYQFNYLWYGHFDADHHHWESADKIYQRISEGIKK